MIVQLLATWIPALLIALSGVMKLSGNPKILDAMATLGVGRCAGRALVKGVGT